MNGRSTDLSAEPWPAQVLVVGGLARAARRPSDAGEKP